jgi:hypothetical protein
MGNAQPLMGIWVFMILNSIRFVVLNILYIYIYIYYIYIYINYEIKRVNFKL